MEFENCEIQFYHMWNSWEIIKSWLEKLGASQVIHAIKLYFVLLGHSNGYVERKKIMNKIK